MSIQLQTRKQGSRVNDPWDEEDAETPRNFSLSVDAESSNSSRKGRRKTATLQSARKQSRSRVNTRSTTPKTRFRHDDRENKPFNSNDRAPVGTQWSKHNQGRRAVSNVSGAGKNQLPVSAETMRTQKELDDIMDKFRQSGTSADRQIRDEPPKPGISQKAIHKEIAVKPWNQDGPTVAATKSKQMKAKHLEEEVEYERQRADKAEAAVQKLSEQLLQSNRVAHVTNSPEKPQRGSPQAKALGELQAQVLRSKNSDLELLVEDLMRENKELRCQQEQFMQMYDHGSGSATGRNQNSEDLQALCEQLKQQQNDAIRDREMFRAENKKMSEQYEQNTQLLKQELEKSKQDCSDLQEALDQMASQVATDRAKCEKLEGDFSAKHDAAEESRKLNQKLLDQQEKTRDRCHTLEIRLSEAERQAAEATRNAESSQRRADQLARHLEETKEAKTKIMSRVADLEEFNAKSESSAAVIEGLQQQLIDAKQRLFAEEKRSTDLEVQCRELMIRLKSAMARPSRAGQESSATSSTAGECMALRRQVEVLTRQVTELEDANAKLALIKTSQVLAAPDTPHEVSSNFDMGRQDSQVGF